MRDEQRPRAAISGPMLYAAVCVYAMTGAVPAYVPGEVVALVPQLAGQRDLLGTLLRLYPESRWEQYDAVVRVLCQAS